MSIRRVILSLIFIYLLPLSVYGEDGIELYQRHCASCHHEKRYGLTGPPLTPETLRRYGDDLLKKVISDGLPATNMPPFREILDEGDILKIISFIKSPLNSPEWGVEEILKTRELKGLSETKGPLHPYDLSNMFMVVEGGTGSVAIMDGDSFKILDKVKVGVIHGGPKYDYSFHYAYMVSRDGWIVKYDLYQLKEVGRIRVGINTRNIAVSDDNKLLAVANYLPGNLIIMDTEDLKPIKIIDVGARVGAVYNIEGERRFIATLKDSPRLFIIRYGRDFVMEEVELSYGFDDLFLEPKGRYAIGTSRGGKTMAVVDIKEKRVIKEFATEGMPHLASAALWRDGDSTYAAIPHIKSPTITILKLYDWEIVKTINTLGPGFFARTHSKSGYIWVDTNTDTLQIIEKDSLKVIKDITPEEGKRAMHIEFTKDGRYALVSIYEEDGAVVIYDNRTFKEIKRIPFVKPVGKYNATNKSRPF